MDLIRTNTKFINEVKNNYISTEIINVINSMDIVNDLIDNCFAKFIGKLPSAQIGYEYMKLANSIPVLEKKEIERILFIATIYLTYSQLKKNKIDEDNPHWVFYLQDILNQFRKKHICKCDE
jgi:hypothetical protein